MSKIEELQRSMVAQEEVAQKQLAAARRNAKQPVVMAYQQKAITPEEYQEVLGETYAETMQEFYNADLEQIRERMVVRVKNGYLTAEQYKEITGDDYPEEV